MLVRARGIGLHLTGAHASIRYAAALPHPDRAAPMTDLLAALLLGIIEGITEFLPISSTGHLLIAEHWLGHRSDLFNIAIQAGAILAVVLIYRQRLWQLVVGFATRAASSARLRAQAGASPSASPPCSAWW